MVSPTVNLPGIEDNFPDDMTPRPLDEHFESSNTPPPPMIQIAPLTLNSIWDSDMMTKYTDDVTGRKKLSFVKGILQRKLMLNPREFSMPT